MAPSYSMQNSTSPRVQIILVNWNGWEDTLSCLKSLLELRYENHWITIIDNGSTDGSVARLEGRATEVLALPKNIGFGAANNVAIRRGLAAGAEYFWVLNNDTQVQPDALQALVAVASADPYLGAVGSTLLNASSPPTTQALGGGRIRFGRPIHITRSNAAPEYLCGASILLRAEAVRQTGAFDEAYFMYWEDADLSARLKAAGWRIATAKESFVTHKTSSSLRGRPHLLDFYFNRSAALYFRKHSRHPTQQIVAGVAARTTKRLLKGQLRAATAVISGAAAGWRASAPKTSKPSAQGAKKRR